MVGLNRNTAVVEGESVGACGCVFVFLVVGLYWCGYWFSYGGCCEFVWLWVMGFVTAVCIKCAGEGLVVWYRVSVWVLQWVLVCS